MAQAIINVTISVDAPTDEQAQGLLAAGLVRFVRTNASRAEVEQEDVSGLSPTDLAVAGQKILRAYIQDCIVADVAREAEEQKRLAVEQGRAATEPIQVEVSIE